MNDIYIINDYSMLSVRHEESSMKMRAASTCEGVGGALVCNMRVGRGAMQPTQQHTKYKVHIRLVTELYMLVRRLRKLGRAVTEESDVQDLHLKFLLQQCVQMLCEGKKSPHQSAVIPLLATITTCYALLRRFQTRSTQLKIIC